ncbi:MAG: SPFH domain-containing protein, partial [Propionibacteriaceae bacterium]|jgi:regulator of protease activity HflC (stomatin/prohibitin superfamily)|nr:SPFH domain-containing protein [Propionibacteriaceae bacterium]
MRIPFIERVVQKVYLGVQQLNVRVDSKTKDNVFAGVMVAVQFQVIEEKAADSYYLLENAEMQIRSFVQDIIRTSLAKLTLDAAFESKDQIANEVEEALASSMSAYGYRIVNTLITDIAPDDKVRIAMNEINAAQRQRAAAVELAEATKIRVVKEAEAAAESRRLAGEGFAAERRAIVNGLTDQLGKLRQAGVDPEAAEVLLLMSQYFDTLTSLGAGASSKVLFVPSDPQGVAMFGQQIRTSIMGGFEATK